MKKWRIALFICLCAALLSVFPPAYAVDKSGPVVRAGQVSGRRGEQVTVEVSIDKTAGIASGGFNVVYDRGGLTLVSAEAGEALTGCVSFVNEKFANNTVRLTFAGAEPLKQSGVLLRLTFTIGRSASFGSHAVTVENVKLSDVEGRTVTAAVEGGGVVVQSVSLRVTSGECVPGGDVQVGVLLTGDLLPCGGEFEIRYNASLLPAASVTGEAALGGVPISLTGKTDTDNGIIRISWAAAEPVGAMGKLCTLYFTASKTASGSARISSSNVRFFDEKGNSAETAAPVDGTITFQQNAPEVTPVLRVAGGGRNEEGASAIQVVVDSAGVACGGEFRLVYDSAACTLESITGKAPVVVTNPETAGAAAGIVSVAWAYGSPPVGGAAVIDATFRMTGGGSAAVRLENVSLTDAAGNELSEVEVYGGKAGVCTRLQMPSVRLTRSNGTLRMDGVLFAVEDGETVQALPVFAFYKGGKLASVKFAENEITVDGMTCFQELVADVAGADLLKVFLIGPAGEWTPLCEVTREGR